MQIFDRFVLFLEPSTPKVLDCISDAKRHMLGHLDAFHSAGVAGVVTWVVDWVVHFFCAPVKGCFDTDRSVSGAGGGQQSCRGATSARLTAYSKSFSIRSRSAVCSRSIRSARTCRRYLTAPAPPAGVVEAGAQAWARTRAGAGQRRKLPRLSAYATGKCQSNWLVRGGWRQPHGTHDQQCQDIGLCIGSFG